MTALVAAQNGNISDEITIKQEILSGVLLEASQVGVKVGTTYTLEQLLNMLLIDSAADAVSRSKAEFLKLMNQKAKELGVNSTSFDNRIGVDYDDGYTKTYSTANDIAILTKEAMKNSTIREIICAFFGNSRLANMHKDIEKLLTYTYGGYGSNESVQPENKNGITGHWAEAQFNDFIKKGYIGGYSDGSLRPNNNITREVAVMIANYKKISDTNIDKINKYIDSNKILSWATSPVEGVVEKGYMGGYSDNTIRPKNNISRAEAVVMLSRIK